MEYFLTSVELKKLEDRLRELDEIEAEIICEIRQLAEDDIYFADGLACERLRQKLNCEIPNERKQIKEKIKNAKIVENVDNEFDGKTVGIMTKVTLDYDGEVRSFSILPVSESDFEKGIVTCNTPIVQRILGKEKGDSVIFNEYNVTIVEVEKI